MAGKFKGVALLREFAEQRLYDMQVERRVTPEEFLLELAEMRIHHPFAERLGDKSEIRIIAELKKSSPSRGMLTAFYEPDKIAQEYAKGGADALSVLTDRRHFMGDEADLRAARGVVDIPVMRKDFICDRYQLAEAGAWGADAVLLIVGVVDPPKLRSLYDRARELRLEVLVESHSREDLKIALELDDAIIGINSRDLRTMRVDISNAVRLAKYIPDGRVSVAESGIRTYEDIEKLRQVGYNAFLIGEFLMRSRDRVAALRKLKGKD